MKKKLAALLVLMLSVSSLAACGSDDTTTETNSTETTAIAEATTTPSVEVVPVEGDVTDLSALPVEEYVTLGDYKNMTVSVTPKETLSDDELEYYVMSYYYNDAQYLAAEDFLTEGTVAETDVVLMDYEGKKDGVAFDGGTATDAVLGIGSGYFIDGFESGLVGVNVGETVDLNLTFPESYSNTELAGQDVVFTVTVKGIVSMTDDTIAKFGISGIETVDDYREGVEVTLLYNIESEYYDNLSAAVCSALLENSTVNSIPESIYEQQKGYVIEQIQTEAAYYGYDADSYTQAYVGVNTADYAVGVAEAYTKQAVIFQAVANAEGLAATQEEIDTFVEDYVATYGESYGYDSVETFYEYNTVEDVKIYLLQEKVVTFIAENANIVDAE